MTPQYILQKSLCRPAHCFDSGDRARMASDEIENMDWSPSYAERGYQDSPNGILFANWNIFPSNIDKILERAGYAVEWSDEWAQCSSCGHAVRTQPDSYGWAPCYTIGDGEINCLACTDWQEHLERLEDDFNNCVNENCNPEDYGYRKIAGDFESGFHPGQNDNPKKIWHDLADKGHRKIVFKISGRGQFDITFEALEKIPESEG